MKKIKGVILMLVGISLLVWSFGFSSEIIWNIGTISKFIAGLAIFIFGIITEERKTEEIKKTT
jgi:hypothetical protein